MHHTWLCKGLLISSTAEITKRCDISWNVSEPPPSDGYLNLLIRQIKPEVCGQYDGVARVIVVTEDHECREAPRIHRTESCVLS